MATVKPENVNLEYKEQYTANLKKEVVAFANTEGGTILIGVRDDRTVIGLNAPDEVMRQAASAFHDGIRPDVMNFVQLQITELEGKQCVEITVTPGTSQPYFLSDKGVNPSGVYKRRGSACLPVSEDEIREMIIHTSGRSYEKGRSIKQDLTFETFKAEMEKKKLPCEKAQMQTLGLIGEDGLYTNLAELLSDQCKHTIKLAIYRGKDKEDFQDRKEFSGSILKQLNDVYAFLELCNRTKATFSGLERIDNMDYPAEALREALLNSVVHRDYAFSGCTLVNIYDDRTEFVSLGGLVHGLSMDDIYLGVSQSRNTRLAELFFRMQLIESYGTGIAKIQRSYRKSSRKPIFESAPKSFRVTLPNKNAEQTEQTNRIQEDLIMHHVQEHGFVTRRQSEGILRLGTTQTGMLLRQMCEKELLRVDGKGRSTKYIKP